MSKHPGILNLHINDNCNNNCWFCSALKKRTLLPTPRMTPQMVNDILSHYPSIRRAYIGGRGEPTLHPELPEIIRILIKSRIIISIDTNGTRISSTRNNIPWRQIESSISVNAITKESYKKITGTDQFNAVIEGMDFLKRQNARMILTFRVSRKEFATRIPEILEFSQRYPELPIGIGALSNWTEGIEDNCSEEWHEHAFFDDDQESATIIQTMKDRAKEMGIRMKLWPRPIQRTGPPVGGCTWPSQHICIDGNGDVRGCLKIIPDFEPAANINELGREAWHSEQLSKLRALTRRGGEHMPKACWQCVVRARS